jgi:pentalenene oxygenase
VGHGLRLLRDPLAFLASLPRYGDLVQVRLGGYSAVVVCNPELTRQVLLDDRTFDKGGPVFDRAREVVGDGLGSCPHSRHRRQRRLTQPAFHPARMPGYARTMTAQIGQAISSWHDGQELDVAAEMLALTLKTSLAAMFSSALPDSVLGNATSDLAAIFRGVYRRIVVPSIVPPLLVPGDRRYRQARNQLRQSIDTIIRARRADGHDHGDLLSALVAAVDPAAEGISGSGNSHGLTDTEIQDQVITFFLAGSETAACTLAWALHLLASHPDIGDRVRAEIDTVLAGRPASFEVLPRLELTQRVITETLRLYPPAWIFTRTATADARLGAHLIPAGTTLAYSPYLIHHHCGLYERPDRFDPGRWAPGRIPPPRHAFIPFGAGARKCIGDQFALTETALALAAIMARWRLEPLPGQDVRAAAAFTLSPQRLRMRVAARRGAGQTGRGPPGRSPSLPPKIQSTHEPA